MRFAVRVVFAFARAVVFRFFAGLAPAFPIFLFGAGFFGPACFFVFFVFFCFMRLLQVNFRAAVFCMPSAATIRKGARKLMKGPPAGKRAWGGDALCH